ncbi:MAG: four helix bundle protein [Kiritimatiellae bacterium]|nr:four helix bundle protein [Kiritimatiellia bacterium]
MRDHTKLDVFHVADQLVVLAYVKTRAFPKDEMFGLTSQIRRSALSIPSNIVEGCARDTESDYLRFLDMAYGSARELQYQISVAERLDYLKQVDEIKLLSEQTAKQLNALIRSLRHPKS